MDLLVHKGNKQKEDNPQRKKPIGGNGNHIMHFFKPRPVFICKFPIGDKRLIQIKPEETLENETWLIGLVP